MSDENIAGDATPPNAPAASGAFDWLRESHQQSAPLAPLSDDVPSANSAVPADPDSAVPADQPQPWAPSAAVPAAAPPQYQQPVQAAPPQYPPSSPTPAPLISPVDPAPAPLPGSAPEAWSQAPTGDVPPVWPSAPQPPVAAPPAWTAASAPSAAMPSAPIPPAWDISPAPSAPAPAPSASAPADWTPAPQSPPAPAAPPTWGSPAAEAPASSPASQVPLIPRPSFMSAPEHQPVAGPYPPAAQLAPPAGGGVTPQASDSAGRTAFPFSDLAAGSADATQQSVAPTAFGGGFGLERHQAASRSGNGPLDWAALVFAIIAPPLGVIVAIVALVVGVRTKGFATGLAKAALAIAIVLSIVLTVAFVVVSKLNADQAHHDAIAASSQTWCTQLKSDPATLSSDTYGWPAPGKTIPDSVTSIQAYVAKWAALEKVAPQGIQAGTARVEDAAKQILSELNKSQTLDDATNVQDMRSAVSVSQVGDWAKQYCK